MYNFWETGSGLSVVKLNGESCSSRGYRMAENKSECEDIARRLDLPYTSAYDSDAGCRSIICLNCYNQSYYRCSIFNYYFKSKYSVYTELYWNPKCADNSKDQHNSANLCVQSND